MIIPGADSAKHKCLNLCAWQFKRLVSDNLKWRWDDMPEARYTSIVGLNSHFTGVMVGGVGGVESTPWSHKQCSQCSCVLAISAISLKTLFNLINVRRSCNKTVVSWLAIHCNRCTEEKFNHYS